MTDETTAVKNVIAAVYDTNGKFLGVKTFEYDEMTNQIVLNGDICMVKIFVWGENLAPYVQYNEIIDESEFKTE